MAGCSKRPPFQLFKNIPAGGKLELGAPPTARDVVVNTTSVT